MKLLVTIARHKVAYQARKERSQRRDNRRVEPLAAAAGELVGGDPSPSQLVAGQELLQAFRQRLTDEEWQLADARAQGRGWAEIATQLGGTPQGRRVQLTRAMERVTQQLGLDERHHE